MGTLLAASQRRTSIIMIKSVIIASLAAVVLSAPEADPALLYSAGLPYAGLGLPYAGLPYAAGPLALASAGAVARVPVVKSVEETPAEVSQEVTAHALPVAVGYHGLGYHGLGSGHYIGKREADPLVLAGSTKILTPPTPLIHNAPVLPTIAHPVAYHGLGGYAGLSGYAGLGYGHYIGKREADHLILAGSTKILTPPTPLIHNAPVLPTIAHPVAYHSLGGYAGLGGY